MKDRVINIWQRLWQEIQANPVIYALLTVVFLAGLIARTYRSYDLLQFYYDQGRDALEVQKILHGHFTLIGPTTGFPGIFRGPFYYYYLAPAYLLARGNPGIAAAIEAAINSLGMLVIFASGTIFFNRKIGVIAVALTALSFYAMQDSRWLSNPAPLWVFAPLVFLSVVLAVTRNWKWMPVGFFLLGLTLQMEEAGMGFVTIAIALFCLLNVRKLSIKQWLLSLVAFFVTFTPLALFELRHQFLITHNVLKLLFGSSENKSFALPLTVGKTLLYFSGEIGKELFINQTLLPEAWWARLTVVLLVIGLIGAAFVYRRNKAFQLLLLWLLVPIGFVMLYKNILFAYYFIGLYAVFFLLVAVALGFYLRNRVGYIVVAVVLAIVAYANLPLLISHLQSHVEQNADTIVLENQTQAIRYIYTASQDKPTAIAVYVPPQTPYTYNYLFPWIRNNQFPNAKEAPLAQATYLFTLHEIDTDHPQMAQSWLASWDKKGTIIETRRFGGITVEKRAVVPSQ